jgi:hypothetical protein
MVALRMGRHVTTALRVRMPLEKTLVNQKFTVDGSHMIIDSTGFPLPEKAVCPIIIRLWITTPSRSDLHPPV